MKMHVVKTHDVSAIVRRPVNATQEAAEQLDETPTVRHRPSKNHDALNCSGRVELPVSARTAAVGTNGEKVSIGEQEQPGLTGFQ